MKNVFVLSSSSIYHDDNKEIFVEVFSTIESARKALQEHFLEIIKCWCEYDALDVNSANYNYEEAEGSWVYYKDDNSAEIYIEGEENKTSYYWIIEEKEIKD